MASRFWQYFHDRLNWPPIFSPGPLSALVKGLALYMDDVREDILWLRRQWTPVTSEEDMIVGYGESRGVPRTRIDTDDLYRQRVISAYIWHMLGGKVRGVERIYLENAFIATILPASLPELWAHFRVRLDVNDTPFGPDASQLAWFLANEYMPARSKIEYFITDITIPLELRVGVGLQSLTQSRSYVHFPSPAPSVLRRRTAMGVTGITTSVLAARAA